MKSGNYYFPNENKKSNPSSRLVSFIRIAEEISDPIKDPNLSSKFQSVWKCVFNFTRSNWNWNWIRVGFPVYSQNHSSDEMKLKPDLDGAIEVKKRIYPHVKSIMASLDNLFDIQKNDWKETSDLRKNFEMAISSNDPYLAATIVGLEDEFIEDIRTLRNLEDIEAIKSKFRDKIIPFIKRKIVDKTPKDRFIIGESKIEHGNFIIADYSWPKEHKITVPLDSYDEILGYDSIDNKDSLCKLAETSLMWLSKIRYHLLKFPIPYLFNRSSLLIELEKALDNLPNS